MSRRIAFLFPGQGAQEVGMGRDLFGRDPFADTLAAAASEAADADIARLCTRGPARALSDTKVLQPALAVVCISLLHRLHDQGLQCSVTAGHSIGELPALVAAGLCDPIEMVKIAALRGRLMAEAAAKSPGAMMAITGCTSETVEEVIQPIRFAGMLGIAAVNAPTQVALSGKAPSVDLAEAAFAHMPDVRVTRLRVSGAWHSMLMAEGVSPLKEALGRIPAIPGAIPMVFNRNGQEQRGETDIPTLVAEQLTHPVRWDLVMKRLIEMGTTDFVEIGPGRVLRGLVRLNTANPGINVHNVTDTRSADRVAALLA